jgi:hypothetical protein
MEIVQGFGRVMPSSAIRRSIFDMVGLLEEVEGECGDASAHNVCATAPAASVRISARLVRSKLGASIPVD